jgi:hypothetical protein
MKNLQTLGTALSRNDQKNVSGGAAPGAWCTNGSNASCYQYLNDAINACLREIGCNSITPIEF